MGAEKTADQGIVERPVTTVGAKGKRGDGALRLREWSNEERMTRALKRLGICWLLAVPLLFVPPHIILGASVFALGPILAFLASRESARVQEQKIACPDCGAEVPVDEQPASWPLAARCRQCLDIFSIERAKPT